MVITDAIGAALVMFLWSVPPALLLGFILIKVRSPKRKKQND